jgi:hypothetical protein
MQALEGYTSGRRWLRHAHTHLRHRFPYLPGQSGYNKRLRAASYLVTYMIRVLARDSAAWHDDVWVVDSTPVECARSRDAVMRSDLAGWAQYGYCASHSRYFWGLRLHRTPTPGRTPRPDPDRRQELLRRRLPDPTRADRCRAAAPGPQRRTRSGRIAGTTTRSAHRSSAHSSPTTTDDPQESIV